MHCSHRYVVRTSALKQHSWNKLGLCVSFSSWLKPVIFTSGEHKVSPTLWQRSREEQQGQFQRRCKRRGIQMSQNMSKVSALSSGICCSNKWRKHTLFQLVRKLKRNVNSTSRLMYGNDSISASGMCTQAKLTDGFYTCRFKCAVFGCAGSVDSAERRGSVPPNYQCPRCGEAAFQTPQQQWLKETLSKAGNPSNSLQLLPGWRPHILTRADALSVPPSRSVTGSFLSASVLFLFPSPFFPSESLSATFHLGASFSLSLSPCRLLASLPSHFPHPSCLPRLHIKAGDWFQTVKQAVFFSCFV